MLICSGNVDSSDHTTTFIELNSYLQNNNCHVANLLPQNFSGKGGMGSALYSMLKQIVKINPDVCHGLAYVKFSCGLAYIIFFSYALKVSVNK